MIRAQRNQRSLVRRAVGVLLALFGVFALFGGLFVPIDVLLSDPQIVPAPESYVAGWMIAMGALVGIWPARRDGTAAR